MSGVAAAGGASSWAVVLWVLGGGGFCVPATDAGTDAGGAASDSASGGTDAASGGVDAGDGGAPAPRCGPSKDYNGDGFDDLVVGAPYESTVAALAGAAYVYFGAPGASFDGVPDVVLGGEAADDLFGSCVAPAGDLNGDGYADLAIGASQVSTPLPYVGAVYVYFGGPAGAFDATPEGVIFGDSIFDEIGRHVAGAGDVNGDGFDDLLVGQYWDSSDPTAVGHAAVYFGGPGSTFDTGADVTIVSGAVADGFADAVGAAGDVNGDAFADVLVGAPEAGNGDGAAYLYYGGAAFDALPDVAIAGDPGAGTRLGFALRTACDVNADGFDDVVVGAPAGAGRAYVFLGGSLFDPTADAVLEETTLGQDADALGWSVGAAGDVDRDGFDDVVVGAPYGYLPATGGSPGRVFLYRGGPGAGFDATSDAEAMGESPSASECLGYDVGWPGDLNGDGFADLGLALPNGGLPGGRVDVYLGAPAFDFSGGPDASLLWSTSSSDGFGLTVADASGGEAASERAPPARGATDGAWRGLVTSWPDVLPRGDRRAAL